MIEAPVIDSDRCTGCGLCIEVCQHNALVLVGDVVVVSNTDDCDWCTACEIVCMEGALTCPFEIVLG